MFQNFLQFCGLENKSYLIDSIHFFVGGWQGFSV